MSEKGKLILLANMLHDGEQNIQSYLPEAVISSIAYLDGLIAESEKGGRYYLKRFPFPEGKSFRDIPIRVLSEHTKEDELKELIAPMKEGKRCGLISDAGLPCLADPGARLVLLCRQQGIEVEATVGPSSIVMALMLSGLGAQKFCFEGYLPKDSGALSSHLVMLQKRSMQEGSTHLFIETPYRSQQMLGALLATLHDRTYLSVSVDLTLPTQEVITKTVKEWKKGVKIDLTKKLCVFVFSAAS